MNNFKNYYDATRLITYWNNYYKEKKVVLPNSDFSTFCLKQINSNESLIDIGCGDGRDSLFFSKSGIFTTGVDFSNDAIEINKHLEHEFLKFLVLNLKDIHKFNKSYDNAYCRFLFHAVSEEIEEKVLNWIKTNIKKKTFIETRIEDSFSSTIKQTHYRRYFHKEKFIKKIVDMGFNILYSKTSKNFSRYESMYQVDDLNEDPLLLRLLIESQ